MSTEAAPSILLLIFPRLLCLSLNGAAADHVFGMNSTNKEVFSRVGREIVESVVNGYNGAIFCYGQTAAGKTYTMQGAWLYRERVVLCLLLSCL